MRIVVITYSQAGNTARAVASFMDGFTRPGDRTVATIDLSVDAAVKARYPMPWRFFDFLHALPECITPTQRVRSVADVDFMEADLIILAYPVWYLSPAAPIAGYLRSLTARALAGKDVLTVSTCRSMWCEAQAAVRALVEEKGGRVVSHAVLQDRAPTYATLVTTPRFYLTGERSFEGRLTQRLFPLAGINAEQLSALAKWAAAFRAGDADAASGFGDFDPGTALSERVGKQIFRALLAPWPLVSPAPRAVQNGFLVGTFCGVFVGIVSLMPPLVITSRIPKVRRRVEQWRNRLRSTRAASPTVGALAPTPFREGREAL